MQPTYRTYRRFVSHRLIEAREEAGLTQKQVGETKIITQSSLSKLENGEGRVEFIRLIKLAKLYGKPIDFFVWKPEKDK
ncbi:MAG: helix-turn-helix transcriptional regulator [Tannerellaceae bacterium]|nr:helix-turn-helix transcriptional regulator [Tannerellaceae bacterium]